MAEPAIETLSDGFTIDVDFAQRVIRPAGELDMATSGMLVEAARSLGEQADDLTIDCGGVTLIGSAGLNALVAISTLQHDRRRNLFLINVSAMVKRRLVTGGCASLL